MIKASLKVLVLLTLIVGTIPLLGAFTATLVQADTIEKPTHNKFSSYLIRNPEAGDILDQIDNVVLEATRRAGLDVDLVPLPLTRGAKMTDAGLYDGHFPRVEEITKEYPNLVKVNSVLLKDNIVAVTRDPSIKIDDWSSLKSYSVGYPGNALYFSAKEEFYGAANPVFLHRNILKMLEMDRFQVVLLWKSYYDFLSGKSKNSDFIVEGEALGTAEAYLFLNKKLKDKAPEIAKALDDMKAEGRFGELCDFCQSRLEVNSVDLLPVEKSAIM